MSANATNQHATMYSNLSDNALMSMFRSESWNKLDENSRLELAQETVNREAAKYGIETPVNVSFVNMSSSTSGYQTGDTICLNRSMYVEDKQTVTYNNTTIDFALEDSNYRCLETIMHETRHVYQEKVSTGEIEADAQTKALFEANNFTVSDINGERGCQYMNGVTGYHCYYLNPTELDAYKYSQEKTAAVIKDIETQYGKDAAMNVYSERISKEGYEATLNSYKELFQNENIDKDVAQVLMNKYHNLNVPVNKDIEAMVSKEMIETQKEIDNNIKSEVNDNMSKIDFSNMHVDRETYDATLRDSVNGFYEHAKNDPSIDKQTAIQETAQVSEGYLNAMAQFDAQQAAQNTSVESSPSVESAPVESASVSTATEVESGAQLSTESETAEVSVESTTVDSGPDAGVDSGPDGGIDGGADGGVGMD